MAQITYANKVALNENPEIANINKVTDDDMNEIKQVVNDNYNNTIQITNIEPTDSDNKIWIDTSSLSQSDNTNMKYNDNGTYKDIYVKAFDTLPVGAIVEYSGSTIPSGWTDIGNDKIQKTSQYMQGGASLSNEYGTSNENGYTQEYINKQNEYSTDEIRVGTWLGKPLYRKVLIFPNGTGQTTIKTYTLSDYGITNVNEIFIAKPSYYSLYSATYPFQYNDGTAYECNVTPTQLRILLGYDQIANSKFVITLEYTKTTD